MNHRTLMRPLALIVGTLTAVSMNLIGLSAAAHADTPPVLLVEGTQAPQCEGGTNQDPADNFESIVADATLMFGERVDSYNEGRVVPLYDAWGTTILFDTEGMVREGQYAAYPPICGTYYDAYLGAAVSEWMFCTDMEAQTCADTNGSGQLVDKHGEAVNPMKHLEGNARLTGEQERLIGYLVQHGSGAYVGVGDQSFGGVTEARSDGTTDQRYALQTLVWCVSDPVADSQDFLDTCEASLPASEQARLLSLLPETPMLELSLHGPTVDLIVGESARFALSTNIYNQPIVLDLAGSSVPTWSVCSGDAVLDGSTLTVNGTDTEVQADIEVCATATVEGDASIGATATPPSLQQIGWSQSQENEGVEEGCQVYATFHTSKQLMLSDSASAMFVVATTPVAPTEPTTKHQVDELAVSGAQSMLPAMAAGVLALLTGLAIVAAQARNARRS